MKKLFEDFLLSLMSEGSTKSYLSYIKNAFEKFSGEKGSIYDFLEEYDQNSREIYCELLVSLLNDEIKNDKSLHNKKTLKNYKSAVIKLGVFFRNEIYPYVGTKVFSKTKDITYNDEDLIEIFKFRLETQDRYYENSCFPCRLFRKIFSKNRHYNNMMKKTIDNTKFLISLQKDYVTLSQLELLVITANGVEAWHHKEIDDVYTEAFSKGKSQGVIKSTANALSLLSLDHEEPLVDIVNREIVSLFELKKVSDALLAFKAKSGLSGSKLCTEFYKKEYSLLGVDEKQLLDDIVAIYDKVQLTIMDKKYNSSKNKNVISGNP